MKRKINSNIKLPSSERPDPEAAERIRRAIDQVRSGVEHDEGHEDVLRRIAELRRRVDNFQDKILRKGVEKLIYRE